MPIETTREQDHNLTIITVRGPVFEEEMYRALEDYYDTQPSQLLLWDMSQAEVAHVNSDILQNFMRRAAELGVSRQGGRTAVFAPKDIQYGLGRMSEAFSELESTPYSFRIFRSREDALLWLKSDDIS